MKIQLVPSGQGGEQNLTAYLIDGVIAIDGGSLGVGLPSEDQGSVRHVFLTHTHLDHIATLPIFLENAYGPAEPVILHAADAVFESLSRDVFNGRLYPTAEVLFGLNPPYMRWSPVTPGQTIEAGDYRVTAFPVDHPVPTYGYRIESNGVEVIIATDTRPLPDLSDLAASPGVKAVIHEAAFPDDLAALAEVSGHCTVSEFLGQAGRLPSGVKLLAVHLKSRYADQIIRQIKNADLDGVEVMMSGIEYYL